MEFNSTRFGALSVPESEIFAFPAGIPGFAKCKKFCIVEHRPGSPFRWLQSCDLPELAFVITDPKLVTPSYDPQLRPSDLKMVDVKDGDDLVVHVILSFRGEPLSVTANLKAPLVFNPRNRLATQVVLEGTDERGERYSLRQPVPLGRLDGDAQPDAPAAAAEGERRPTSQPERPQAAAAGAY